MGDRPAAAYLKLYMSALQSPSRVDPVSGLSSHLSLSRSSTGRSASQMHTPPVRPQYRPGALLGMLDGGFLYPRAGGAQWPRLRRERERLRGRAGARERWRLLERHTKTVRRVVKELTGVTVTLGWISPISRFLFSLARTWAVRDHRRGGRV